MTEESPIKGEAKNTAATAVTPDEKEAPQQKPQQSQQSPPQRQVQPQSYEYFELPQVPGERPALPQRRCRYLTPPLFSRCSSPVLVLPEYEGTASSPTGLNPGRQSAGRHLCAIHVELVIDRHLFEEDVFSRHGYARSPALLHHLPSEAHVFDPPPAPVGASSVESAATSSSVAVASSSSSSPSFGSSSRVELYGRASRFTLPQSAELLAMQDSSSSGSSRGERGRAAKSKRRLRSVRLQRGAFLPFPQLRYHREQELLDSAAFLPFNDEHIEEGQEEEDVVVAAGRGSGKGKKEKAANEGASGSSGKRKRSSATKQKPQQQQTQAHQKGAKKHKQHTTEAL
jgi:hypothetical protein